MNRRMVLGGLAAATAAAQTQVSTPEGTDSFGPSVDNVPIIDAHIHLFDGRSVKGSKLHLLHPLLL